MTDKLNIEKGAYVPEGNPSEEPPTKKEPTRIMRLNAKCSDMCSLSIPHLDISHDGYVPEGLGIGDFYGDYIEMVIDLDTGTILNWEKLSDTKIRKIIKDTEGY